MVNNTMNSRSRCFMVALSGIVIATITSLFIANIWFGNINQDEGWYLYASRLVSQGKLPYVDFAFTQGPVMPFVYFLAQPLVNHYGVLGGRLFTALIGALTILLASFLAYRIARQSATPFIQKVTALATFILTGINVYQIYYFSIVKTYALAGFFLIAGFVALTYLSEKKGWLGALLSGFLFALAAGTRTSAGFVIPVIFFVVLLHAKGREKEDGSPIIHNLLLWFIPSCVLSLAVIFIPFLIKAPTGLWFAMFEYHAGRASGGLISALLLKGGSICRLVGAYTIGFVLLISVCIGKFNSKCQYDKSKDSKDIIEMSLWISVLVVGAIHLAVAFPYDEYQTMIYPLFAVAVMVAFIRMLAGTIKMLPVLTFVFLACVMSSASSPIVQGWVVGGIDRLWIVPVKETPLQNLQDAGRRVRKLAGANRLLLTQDTYLAVESGLDVPAGMELGPFCYFPDWTEQHAKECHVLNKKMLTNILNNSDASVAAISGWGLCVQCPSVTELSDKDQQVLQNELRRRYTPYGTIKNFGHGGTVLTLYKLTTDEVK